MSRQRNAFEGSAARTIEAPSAAAAMRKRKQPELRVVEKPVGAAEVRKTAARHGVMEILEQAKQDEIRTQLEEGPAVTFEDMALDQSEAIQALDRAREERKVAQDEMAAAKRLAKKLESQLAKYGDPFDLANDLARPNIGVGERFGRFLGRITGQPATQGSYDQLIAAWNENAARVEALELKLDAIKREEAAAKQRGEHTNQHVGDMAANASSETRRDQQEKSEAELSNIRDIMDAAVMSYETKREEGVLTLKAIEQIKRVLQDLDDRASKLLGDHFPYDQDVANIKLYLQNALETLERTHAQLQGLPAPEQPVIIRKAEEKLEEFEGQGTMREALNILEDLIAKKQAFWETAETMSANKGPKKPEDRTQLEAQKREIDALEAQGRVAWEERLSFGEKGFLQFQISELERYGKEKNTPAWMRMHLAKETQALKHELEKMQKAERSLRAEQKTKGEPVEEIAPEEVVSEPTLEEMQRLVPDEIFRLNNFKQAFLEEFEVKNNDSEKKREAIARKKTATYEKLRKALDAEKNTDLARVYVNRLAEYRLLQDQTAKGFIAERNAANARLARLKNGLEAVKKEFNLPYETERSSQQAA